MPMAAVNWTLVIAIGSLSVAAWSAWTSHQTRRSQRRADAERRATKVRVSLSYWYNADGTEVVSTGAQVTVVNDGEATEYISRVTVWGFRRLGDMPIGLGPADPEQELAPRNRARFEVKPDISEPVFEVAESIHAEVWLASGVVCRSDPAMVPEDSPLRRRRVAADGPESDPG